MKTIFQHTPHIQKRMKQLLGQRRKLIVASGKQGQDTYDMIVPRVDGGKMIRGNLFVFSAAAYGYTDAAVYDVAAALEFLQLGILIHDDIMDEDDMRRGMPTLHAAYRQRTDARTADSLALCIGDILFFLATDCIVSSDLSSGRCRDVTQYIATQIVKTGVAQMDDVYFTQSTTATIDDVMRLYQYKTAEYTFVLPLVAGAIAAGHIADRTVLETVGREIGIIFQIRDDMLDVFGDEKKTGKPVGSDISENKKTALSVLLHERASAPDRADMDRIFGASRVSPVMVHTIQEYIRRYEIDTYLDAEVAKRQTQAREAINKLSVPSGHKTTLADLVDYVSSRDI